jgi:branched-chain amino acid transport system substrate-binding protein
MLLLRTTSLLCTALFVASCSWWGTPEEPTPEPVVPEPIATPSVSSQAAAPQPTEPKLKDIKIGVILPMKGEMEAFGKDVSNGARMGLETLNGDGGVNGRTAELIIRNSKCSAEMAEEMAIELIEEEEVMAIIGGACKDEALALASIANEKQIPLLSPIARWSEYTDAGEYAFRTVPSFALQAEAAAKYLHSEEYERIAIISEGTKFCTDFHESLAEEFGSGAYVFEDIVPPGLKNYANIIGSVKEAQYDVLVLNGHTPESIANMVIQIRQHDVTKPLLSHDIGDSSVVTETVREGLEGMTIIGIPIVGNSYGDKGFKSWYGYFSDHVFSSLTYPALGYDAVRILGNAMIEAGTEGPDMRDALANMETFAGIAGTYHFDENGDVVGIPYSRKYYKHNQIWQGELLEMEEE